MRSYLSKDPGRLRRRALSMLLALAVTLPCLPAAAEDSPALRINEVMTSNRSAVRSSYGYGDWVEVTNTSTAPVRLKGHTLSKADVVNRLFVFPDITLAPGECVVVWMDGYDRAAPGCELHAAFGLSASGVTLLLCAPDGSTEDSVAVPPLEGNTVYARGLDGEWAVSYSYTPGAANTEENHAALTGSEVSSDIIFSEAMSSNASYPVAPDGSCTDYVELMNLGTSDCDLSGWHLSDDPARPERYTFPEGTRISAGGCLAVSCGKRGEAGFGIGSDGAELLLYDAYMNIRARLELPALETDSAWSYSDGSYTSALAPTPGLPNTTESANALRRELESRSGCPILINEIGALSQTADYDWIELYNASGQAVELSGWGLSDSAGHPRSWTFPAGTTIGTGQYLLVYASGKDGTTKQGVPCASFRLGVSGGYAITLCTPDGTITDRVFVPEQTDTATYSRVGDRFLYTTEMTPSRPNADTGYTARASKPTLTRGGACSGSVTVTMQAPAGQTIRYTTDCTEPTAYSATYTGPLELSETTVVRARAFGDGLMDSRVETQTYLFGTSTTMRIVSVVADPEAMFGTNGLYTRYEERFEIDGHVEVYTQDGTELLDEGCSLKIAGADSRLLPQKNIKVLARSRTGASTFKAPLFSARDYEEFDGFVLRSSSEDTAKTRMRDSVLTALAEGTGLYYQPTELCVVYINGEYWGHYNMRERVCVYNICQFEGWTGHADDLDLTKGNSTALHGSNADYKALLEWIRSNDMSTADALEYVASQVDIDNYIAYIALEMFVGNGDTMNVKRYRNRAGDNKWRWVVYDLDWGFSVDTNSMRRWLDPGGMGVKQATDNTLFVGLMKNAAFRDRFMTYLGRQMAGPWSTETVLAAIDARYRALLPELPAQFARWGSSMKEYEKELQELTDYARTRVGKLMGYCQYTLSLSADELQRYFGDVPDEIIPYSEGAES